MPIVNYEANAESAYKAIQDSKDISDVNKDYAAKFDRVYKTRVRPATRAKFWRHLTLFLEATEDCKALFQDRDAVNTLFEKLHTELSPGYYITVLSCTNRFVKWLNDDIKPAGFRDVVSPKKSLQRRKLSKADMWDWDDALKVAQQTNSTQLKAMLLTQLNLGARPSEFVDLNYSDIEAKGDFMLVTIRDGKTGGREAILYHAVPYLARWLNDHPTKEPEAPLWILEDVGKSHRKKANGEYATPKPGVVRAGYPGIRKRIDHLKAKAGINKGSDFYTLRHSCARLLRLWGVPVEECAKQLGHSVKEFTETYGRLDTSDRELRHARAFGIEVDDTGVEVPKPRKCVKCNELNDSSAEFCGRCGAAMTVKKALEREEEERQKFSELLNDYFANPENKQRVEQLGLAVKK